MRIFLNCMYEILMRLKPLKNAYKRLGTLESKTLWDAL